MLCPIFQDLQHRIRLAEIRPWESPYAFCGGNPVNRIDPNGLHWVADKDNKINWNNDATSVETTPEGYTYIGETANGTDANGDYINYAQDGKTYDSTPLSEVTVTVSMPTHIKNMRDSACLNICSGTEVLMNHPVTIVVSLLVGLPGMIEGIGGLQSVGLLFLTILALILFFSRILELSNSSKNKMIYLYGSKNTYMSNI